MQTMEDFLNNLSDKKLRIPNIKIELCGVGYHHQNAIVERKIQTLTLEDRKFLIHEKIYWPEAITTMV